jgi:3-oxoacyl-[acyl-carrier protein] reductase
MQNKTIVITGASKGLGSALAERWCENNTVINVSRTSVNSKLKSIVSYQCDLRCANQINKTFSQLTKDHPQIDVLVNNAAVLTSSPLAIMNPDKIIEMIDVNLTAPMLISRLIFRQMMSFGGGQIINVLSMASKLNIIGDAVYAGSKSGLEAFSKVLNKEGHKFGIRVNNVGVSAFQSGMLEQLLTSNNGAVIEKIPHGKLAPIEEIVSTIEFFVKNKSDIGGQSIFFGGV